ncbi:glycosyltransferase family 4 protein [Gaetbulibacter sp. M235]|uniref:glycosyltransferase family 4 protein n=1 Tax=Gaetbulibacter sp. M235 TaxID=3126510 RepID=UPI00374EEE69
MKYILYIGNKLSSKPGNLTSIDILCPLLKQEGYQVFYASAKTNKFVRFLDMLWTCFKLRQTVDVVLIDTYSTLNFFYAFFVSQLCRILKLKYIPILHGGNLPKRLRENPLFCRLIFNNAYKNVSPSQYLKKAFEAFGYSNIIYIPNTIELQQYVFKQRDLQEVKLFWVRAFSNIYNPTLAVKILKALQDEGIKTSLCMVGPDADGSLAEVIALANKLHVDVIFTGKLTKPEWIALSQDYTVFINTTNFDNMPVSVIEAMALGLPVVSTNVGGMPFLIENEVDGLLIAPNSVDAFVDAIKTIIHHPEKAIKMTHQARLKVEQFDRDIVKQQWLALFQ